MFALDPNRTQDFFKSLKEELVHIQQFVKYVMTQKKDTQLQHN